jgi:hypothetical protein
MLFDSDGKRLCIWQGARSRNRAIDDEGPSDVEEGPVHPLCNAIGSRTLCSSLFMDNSMLIEERCNILQAKIFLPLVHAGLLEGAVISLILHKGQPRLQDGDGGRRVFVMKRYIQQKQVASSMNVKTYCIPSCVGGLTGPQRSEYTQNNIDLVRSGLAWKGLQTHFAWMQTGHCAESNPLYPSI